MGIPGSVLSLEEVEQELGRRVACAALSFFIGKSYEYCWINHRMAARKLDPFFIEIGKMLVDRQQRILNLPKERIP